MWFMNRIITENYIDKLNDITRKFEPSYKILNLLDFFIDEVNKDQKRSGNRNQKIFSSRDLKNLIQIKKSKELNRLFAYLNIIIQTFSGENLHIHINSDLSDETQNNLMILFSWQTLLDSFYEENTLENEISRLENETNRDLIIPSDNNGHSTNQIYRKRYGLKHRLKFIKEIKKNMNSKGGTLLNLNSSADCIVNLSEFSDFPPSNYGLVNFGSNIQSIYDENKLILQNISTIISLFPSERGRNIWFADFLPESINSWNQFPEYNFNKLITITSGEKNSKSLLEMQKQKKFQSEEIYTVFSFEL